MIQTIKFLDGVQGNKIKVVGMAIAVALLMSMFAYSTPVEARHGGSEVFGEDDSVLGFLVALAERRATAPTTGPDSLSISSHVERPLFERQSHVGFIARKYTLTFNERMEQRYTSVYPVL